MNEKKKQSLSPASEQLFQMMAQALQLERLVWLVVNEQGGAVVVDEASLNPLWSTKYERVEGHKTLLKITASQLQEPTDTQIQRLADLLVGQTEEATPNALLQVGLSGYPASYVIARLAPLVQCRDGKWTRI